MSNLPNLVRRGGENVWTILGSQINLNLQKTYGLVLFTNLGFNLGH